MNKQDAMQLDEVIAELERRCGGTSFRVDGNTIRLVEYGRPFVVDLEELGITPEEWFAQELEHHPRVVRKRPDGQYRVICPMCGPVVIGYGNYYDQMMHPDSPWYCPRCGGGATFDDDRYDSFDADFKPVGGEKV